MPKLRKCSEQVVREARDAVSHDILMQRTDLGLYQRDIAQEWGITEGTASVLLKDLDKLTVPRLRALVQLLGLDPVNVMLWLGYSEKQIQEIRRKKDDHG